MTIKVEKQLSNDRDKVLIIVISPFSLSSSRLSLKQKEVYQHFSNAVCYVAILQLFFMPLFSHRELTTMNSDLILRKNLINCESEKRKMAKITSESFSWEFF